MSGLQGTQLKVALGGVTILKGVNFNLEAGEMLGLVGPNGAGKTTLLRILAGLLKPDAGKLSWGERDYYNLTPRERAQRLAYLAQSGTAHWPMSVERLVALGRLPHLSDWQRPGEQDDALIQRVMAETDLSDFKERQFNTLSGGERSRVLMARALVAEPEILLADEPVAALDLAHQIEVMSLLQCYCEQGGSVVVVLHDVRLASHYCQRIMLLMGGETLAEGTPDTVLTEANMRTAFGVEISPDTGSIRDTLKLPWVKA
ncbi:MAG: ABC transporter ATP-binding protein [Sedimenticola thiotaurini]|uniref:ABC transporter ATP-binding protein n=1 Tax=Sedimenticola thiotaurini TaxID=1543721 RepID=A0A558CPJ0_9GAMM|nr:MAG: ABC transporter ATP-binding protein [Sedimenticola thiotaurini]